MKLSSSIILTWGFKNIFQSKIPEKFHTTCFVSVRNSVLIQLLSTEQQSGHSVGRQTTMPVFLPHASAHTHTHTDTETDTLLVPVGLAPVFFPIHEMADGNTIL